MERTTAVIATVLPGVPGLQAQNLPGGVYFCRLSTGASREEKEDVTSEINSVYYVSTRQTAGHPYQLRGR